jgi:transcription factor S
MTFCPKCEKILVKRTIGDKDVMVCPICGYQSDQPPGKPFRKKFSKAKLERKKADNMTIIADERLKKFFPPIDSNMLCYKCKSHEIEFFQIQIRRADEPMTTFFRCRNCGNRWRG